MDFKSGLNMLMSQGQILTLLPIEKWTEDLRSMDTVAPILDPTKYREWLASGRREPMLAILDAYCQLKAAMTKWNDAVEAGKIL